MAGSADSEQTAPVLDSEQPRYRPIMSEIVGKVWYVLMRDCLPHLEATDVCRSFHIYHR